MKKKSSVSYLRAYRLRWGLSQVDLAYLLGWKTDKLVIGLEKKRVSPSARVVIGCYIIFGTRAAELFPGMFQEVEAEVLARVWDLYERLQGDPSKKTKVTIELLEDAIERAKQRERNNRS
jgi:transcriptional regulator with XRE-family HTH domain